LIAKLPLSAMIASADALRLMQASMVGGSAETEQTAVAVSPLRMSPIRLVTIATDEATWRMPILKS
jgi:hypothetical protein